MDLASADRNSKRGAWSVELVALSVGHGFAIRGLVKAPASGLTLHASRSTLHASRSTPHAPRLTLHASRPTIAREYRTCAGHAHLSFDDGAKCSAGIVIVY